MSDLKVIIVDDIVGTNAYIGGKPQPKMEGATYLERGAAEEAIERLTAEVQLEANGRDELLARNKVLEDRAAARIGAKHYGPYGTNCMYTGQFDAGECWLCYAKRKKKECERLTVRIDVLEDRLSKIHDELMNLQPHIPQACKPGHCSFIDSHVDVAMAIAAADHE